MTALAVALGAVVGVVLGLTGAGGSIFAVPLLMWGLGWTLPQAVPVALVAVCAAAAFGTIAAWDVRYVRYRAALLLAATAWITAPFGLQAARVMPVTALGLLFAAVLLVVALRMVLQVRRAPEETAVVRAAERLPVCHLDPLTGRFDWTPASVAAMTGIGAATGLLAGLLGVGGGFVIVPALVLFSGMAIRRAVGTSLLVITLVSASGVASHLWAGRDIPIETTLYFIIGGVLGMFLGISASRRLSGPALQKFFAVAIVAVAIFVILRTTRYFGS